MFGCVMNEVSTTPWNRLRDVTRSTVCRGDGALLVSTSNGGQLRRDDFSLANKLACCWLERSVSNSTRPGTVGAASSIAT